VSSTSRIPAGILQAYRETLFIVHTAEPIVLRVDVANASLLQMYRDTGTDGCAFITAYNPYSQQLSDTANAERQAKLKRDLQRQGWAIRDGIGRHPSALWPGEPSFLVLGISADDAQALGRQYEQNAIVWCGPDAVPKLVLLR
jgi:hypothetical protein